MSSTSGSSVDLQMSRIGDPWGRVPAFRSVAFARCDIYELVGAGGSSSPARVWMTASTSRSALAGFPVWGAGNPGQK